MIIVIINIAMNCGNKKIMAALTYNKIYHQCNAYALFDIITRTIINLLHQRDINEHRKNKETKGTNGVLNKTRRRKWDVSYLV
jgi:hypothetical protein